MTQYFTCPWCPVRAYSGEAMHDHVATHEEARGKLLCGSCWQCVPCYCDRPGQGITAIEPS